MSYSQQNKQHIEHKPDVQKESRYATLFRLPLLQTRPFLLLGLLITIPAFYLLISPDEAHNRHLGRYIYALVAVILSVETAYQMYLYRDASHQHHGKLMMDILIIVGCWGFALPWQLGMQAWVMLSMLCAIIMLRMITLAFQHARPSYLFQFLGFSVLGLAGAGLGFYWLEPDVNNFADGVWLAFTTMATVGYGDIVPTTTSSKIFAIFVVIFGYALFSIITANIAALFVEEEEEKFEAELNKDIKALREEMALLRAALQDSLQKNKQIPDEDSSKKAVNDNIE